jgi:hypothetical protein
VTIAAGMKQGDNESVAQFGSGRLTLGYVFNDLSGIARKTANEAEDVRTRLRKLTDTELIHAPRNAILSR